MKTFAILVGLVLASPVDADDYLGFQSPTGNIHCAMYIYDGSAEARCDLRD